MKILRIKLFAVDEEWTNNTIAEQERNKIRDKKLKKLNLHDKVVAQTIWDDTDTAGRARYRRNQAVSGLIGAAGGAALGAVVGKKVKDSPKIGALAGAVVGGKTAKLITHKKNRRISEKIWDKGDKEQMNYIEASPEKKKKIEKEYVPIGWRVDRKGEYWKDRGQKDVPYFEESLEDRVKAREAYIKAVNSLETNKRTKKKVSKKKDDSAKK